MDKPRTFLREYIDALTLGTVALNGELADGVMLYLCAKSRIPAALAALDKSIAMAGRTRVDVDVTTSVLSCIHDDIGLATEAAQNNLGFYGGLPY